MTDFDLRSS